MNAFADVRYLSHARFEQVDTRFDRELGIYWAWMNPRPRACFNRELLSDLSAWVDTIENAGGTMADAQGRVAPVHYAVIASRAPGVFNLGGDLALFRSAQSPNFELDDVRLIEFIGRLAMALLEERRDRLSGLMNRAAFERHLDTVLRADSPAGTLVYFDIVALREINAAWGLRAGDEAIVRAAQLIRRALGSRDVACRLAGDSFAVHLPEQDVAAAAEFGGEIAQAAADLGYVTGGSRVPLTLRFASVAPDSASPGRCPARLDAGLPGSSPVAATR